jgi:glycosyltransferase involved in cell wall biosynthesis
MGKNSKIKILGFSFGNIKDRSSWSGTNFHFYRALRKHCEIVRIINNFKFGINPLKSRSYSRKYLRLNFPVALIHNNPKKYYKIIKKEVLKVKKPYDLILHLNTVPFLSDNKPFTIYLDAVFQHRSVYKKATLIFTFSNCLRDFLIKKYKIEPGKVVSVGAGPNFIRLPKIVAKKYEGKTILFVGNRVSKKGGLVLLKAFKKVKSKVKDARLIMISSQLEDHSKGERGRNLKKFDVFIKGFSNKKTLGSWYRKADLFVLPSLIEPFGIVLLEAMAYKLPCIATRRYAMREIIEEGKTGFLVRSKSPSALADRIVFLLKHPEVSRKMGEAGYQKVIQYYNWDKVVERMLYKIKMALNKGN